jgi:hypothetical protein
VTSIHADITNQYILEATRGGALSLAFYLMMLFAALHLLLRARAVYHGRRLTTIIIWSVLTAFAVHLVSFTGVSYFGQIIMLWFLTLAMAGSIGDWALQARQVLTQPHTARIASRGQGVLHA